MSILVVGSTKGGSGKTTLATNLAVLRTARRRSVLLIDGDKQENSLSFTQLRDDNLGNIGFAAVSLRNRLLSAQGADLAAKYDDTIIDVGGQDNLSLRAALLIAETVLVPVQPRTYDILAFQQTLEIIEDARAGNPHEIRVCTILNMADPAGRDNEEALEFLKGIEGIEVLASIGRRKSFSTR